MSLCNVDFHRLKVLFIQLASSFMQLAVAGHRCNILHFHCLFEGKMLLVHKDGDFVFKIFICGGISLDIHSGIMFYGFTNMSL